MTQTQITQMQLMVIAQRLRARYPNSVLWANLPVADRTFWLDEAEKILKPAEIEVTR